MGREFVRKLMVLLCIMCFITVLSVGITMILNNEGDKEETDNLVVVTSFYPMYIATKNVVDGVEGVRVVNLMEQTGGCLHDYQLTTSDMKKLEGADAFVMNGGGMEGYIEEVMKAYPEVHLIDASKGIALLPIRTKDHDHTHEEAHDHSHEEEEDHNHGEYNSHVWLNPILYQKQIQTIAEQLVKVDPENSTRYMENAKEYEAQVAKLWEEVEELGEPKKKEVVLFHDSMEYLLDPLGIEVIYSVALDGENSLSAGEISTVIDEVKEHNIQSLFSEVQFEQGIAEKIAKETNANVYVFDSLVSGEDDLESYLNGMKKNINLLKQALYE